MKIIINRQKFYKNLLNKKYDQEWTNLKFNKEEKNWVKLK